MAHDAAAALRTTATHRVATATRSGRTYRHLRPCTEVVNLVAAEVDVGGGVGTVCACRAPSIRR
ncbi:hypothetical protein [Mobilicoccus sp.]|uniref:hypothetical protein n=1 Tax=Mobilicoccus sp. TaxID=2034349 RepID=UPI00289AA573|nr:hypothetical protein [Mobilicoccus sp.]